MNAQRNSIKIKSGKAPYETDTEQRMSYRVCRHPCPSRRRRTRRRLRRPTCSSAPKSSCSPSSAAAGHWRTKCLPEKDKKEKFKI